MRDTEHRTCELGDYQIGHCKPPKAYQWPKGRSGNPAGKKKGVKNIGAAFRKVANKVVKLKGGGTKTMMELLIDAPAKHGMKGNTSNAIQALSIIEEFGMETPGSEHEPKFGVIYRDLEGDPKVDYQYYPDRLAKQVDLLDRLVAEFALDDKNPDQPVFGVSPNIQN